MGLLKIWKQAKALTASGPPSGAKEPKQGMAMGFAGAMMKMVGPLILAQAPERGEPLRGTEPGVLDGQDPAALQSGVADVRQRDTAFDPAVLTTFADQVFAAVCSVWGTGEASPVRDVLADGLWEPLSATLASGLGAQPGTLYSRQQGKATLRGAWAGQWYDSALFNVAVNVEALANAEHPIPPGFSSWNEDWLFQRSVEPGGTPMTTPATCPSCGAAASTDDKGLCVHCHQPVPMLTSGWLVTAVRSHNPMVEMMRAQIVSSLHDRPDELRMMPDELVRLLPADEVAKIDPQRAAALGLTSST